MSQQYYAIIMRDKKHNDEVIHQNEYSNYTLDEINEFSAKIISTKNTYKEAYDELQKTIKDYPELASFAGYIGLDPNIVDLEFCIARITVMKDWTSLK